MTIALIIIALVIAAVLLMGALKSPDFSIAREADFNAPPGKIYSQLNDFKNWSAWSPWEKMDPNLQRNYSGAASGVGAKYSWMGNKKVGEGNMEITQSENNRRIQLDLHFLKPFQADNVTEFTIQPKGTMTNLRWEMRGKQPFMMRVMSSFMNMDKMVGKDFEAGLANLKGVVEK